MPDISTSEVDDCINLLERVLSDAEGIEHLRDRIEDMIYVLETYSPATIEEFIDE